MLGFLSQGTENTLEQDRRGEEFSGKELIVNMMVQLCLIRANSLSGRQLFTAQTSPSHSPHSQSGTGA